jgi:hypothetical protein
VEYLFRKGKSKELLEQVLVQLLMSVTEKAGSIDISPDSYPDTNPELFSSAS